MAGPECELLGTERRGRARGKICQNHQAPIESVLVWFGSVDFRVPKNPSILPLPHFQPPDSILKTVNFVKIVFESEHFGFRNK